MNSNHSSTIFINGLTVIDAAFLSASGHLVGTSFNASVAIRGPVEEPESVVIDFSACKKRIKALIDDRENGYDHKLWYDPSMVSMRSLTPDVTEIWATHVRLTVPTNATRAVNFQESSDIFLRSHPVAQSIEAYLNAELQLEFPGVEVTVSLDSRPAMPAAEMVRDLCVKALGTEDIALRSAAYPSGFHYTHGLKNSSSWGCQNIAHGHFSFFSVYTEFGALVRWNDIIALQDEIAEHLDNTVFINQENVVGDIENEVSIQYETPDRGKFSMTLDSKVHKLVILTHETTIEYLAKYVRAIMGERMKALGIRAFAISEGPNKGTIEII